MLSIIFVWYRATDLHCVRKKPKDFC